MKINVFSSILFDLRNRRIFEIINNFIFETKKKNNPYYDLFAIAHNALPTKVWRMTYDAQFCVYKRRK